MMRVNTAVRAKVMLGRERVELIELKLFCTFNDANATQRDGRDNSALASANGTVTAPRVDDAVGKRQLEFD